MYMGLVVASFYGLEVVLFSLFTLLHGHMWFMHQKKLIRYIYQVASEEDEDGIILLKRSWHFGILESTHKKPQRFKKHFKRGKNQKELKKRMIFLLHVQNLIKLVLMSPLLWSVWENIDKTTSKLFLLSRV